MRLLLPILVSLLHMSNSYHVLFVHNMGTKSHLILMKSVMEELLERGHTVTSIIFSSVNIKHDNYTEIVIPSQMEAMMKEGSKKLMEKGGSNMMSPSLWWWAYTKYNEVMEDMALDMVRPEMVKQLIKDKPRVDAVVMMMPITAIFADIFDCPIIVFSPVGPISFIMEGSTNVINHSVQPYPTLPFIEPMTLANRLANHAMIVVGQLFMDWQMDSMFHYQQEFLKAELGVDIKYPLSTMRERFSLMLTCSHPITHGAWQYRPNIIQVGGLQLTPPKPLPKDLLTFMDSATEGAVLVSFGSSLKPDQMPAEKIAMFIDTFKQLGMKVIWKWDDDIPDLPANIMLSSWLPQQDLLAHPNLKVFVTHGGMGSLVEAIYHKVVIVGMPLSNDQKPNLLRAERHGYAVHLNWDDVTAPELVSSIQKAMVDKEMAANLERIHRVYMDREERPVEKAAWWVEYVCRHRGADWLKSQGGEVPYYQHHHWDIIAILTLVSVIAIALTFYFWRAVYRCCCARKPKTD